jgi:predicted transcriptional regulator
LIWTKIKKAIERHQREVELSKQPDYPYIYRPEEFDNIIEEIKKT